MTFTLVNHFIFITAIILLSLSECCCRCSHILRVGLVPGVIVFNGDQKDGCVWTLHSPDMDGINLMVLSTTFTAGDCTGSRLDIRHGTLSGGHIEDICTQTKRTLHIRGHYVTLVYHASSSYKQDRFRLKYTVYDSSVCNAGYRLAGSKEKTIISPNYPHNYSRNTKCKWLLDSDSEHKHVQLEVLDSHIEGSKYFCFWDYVLAFDGSSSSFKSLGKWCGQEKPTKKSSGRYMYIEFNTDASMQYKGFKIAYKATDDGPQSTKVGVIIGSMMAAGLAIIALTIWFYSCYKGKCMGFCKRVPERQYRSHPPPISRSNVSNIPSRVRERTNSMSLSLSSQESLQETTPRREDLPPAYDDVIKDDPPSYSQALSDNMEQSANQNSRTIGNNEESRQICNSSSETSIGHREECRGSGTDNRGFQRD